MTIREINNQIEEAKALKAITGAYTEIAALKLRRIRQEVISSRSFFTEILNLFSLVRKKASKGSKNKKSEQKTAGIILTSNNRFYGHIDADLINFFERNLSKTLKTDIFVIGRGGIQALHLRGFSHFADFIFKQDLPSPYEISQLVSKIKNYQRILIFYSQFQTVVKQNPKVVDITQQQLSAISYQLSDKEQKKSDDWRLTTESFFIFEPEVSKILDFFDSQLKQILIEQTFLEAELARTGSRLIFMDQAQNNADEYLEQQEKFLNSAKRSLQNARILEIIGSMIRKEI